MAQMPHEPEMPPLWDLSLQEAEAVLAGAGIPYRIARSQSRTIPEGQVLSVAPVAGTVMRPGMEAVLTVSHGPPVARDRE
jgi:beta-lactam-binding protein with PASTA domain